MWDCIKCGVQRIAASLWGCPKCGTEREDMPKSTTGGASNADALPDETGYIGPDAEAEPEADAVVPEAAPDVAATPEPEPEPEKPADPPKAPESDSAAPAETFSPSPAPQRGKAAATVVTVPPADSKGDG